MNGAGATSPKGAKKAKGSHEKPVIMKNTSDLRLANSTAFETTVSLDGLHPDATDEKSDKKYTIFINESTTVANYLAHIAKKNQTSEPLYLIYHNCVCAPYFELFELQDHYENADFESGYGNKSDHTFLKPEGVLRWTTSPYHLKAGRFPGYQDILEATKAVEETKTNSCCALM